MSESWVAVEKRDNLHSLAIRAGDRIVSFNMTSGQRDELVGALLPGAQLPGPVVDFVVRTVGWPQFQTWLQPIVKKLEQAALRDEDRAYRRGYLAGFEAARSTPINVQVEVRKATPSETVQEIERDSEGRILRVHRRPAPAA